MCPWASLFTSLLFWPHPVSSLPVWHPLRPPVPFASLPFQNVIRHSGLDRNNCWAANFDRQRRYHFNSIEILWVWRIKLQSKASRVTCDGTFLGSGNHPTVTQSLSRFLCCLSVNLPPSLHSRHLLPISSIGEKSPKAALLHLLTHTHPQPGWIRESAT